MKSLKLLVFTLSIAMLMAVSACASPPPPTPVYTPNFTESEAIAIARESTLSQEGGGYNKSVLRDCWWGSPDYRYIEGMETSRTASLKKNGLWVVTVKADWGTEGRTLGIHSCTFLVDDATGKVREP